MERNTGPVGNKNRPLCITIWTSSWNCHEPESNRFYCAARLFYSHFIIFLFVAHLLLRANSACMTTLFSTQWRDFQPRYYSSFITFTRFYFTLLPVSFSFFICCHFSPSRHFCVLFLYTGICSLILSLPLPPICYFYTLPS